MHSRSLFLVLALLAIAANAPATAAAQTRTSATPRTTTAAPAIHNVVLVHGAYADGSSYSKVIPLLRARGLKVTAVQNPLTSLANDVAATRRAIARQDGPVILVGHSSAGVVITQAGDDPKVVGLVYISAIIPDVGQSALDAITGYPPTPGGSQQPKDAGGYLTITHQGIVDDFVPDIPMAERELVYATQGDWYSGFLTEKVTVAAWRTKPSWVIIPEDRMVPPQHQRDAAKRMGATTIVLKSGHVPMLSQPARVADVILDAVANAGRRTVAVSPGH